MENNPYAAPSPAGFAGAPSAPIADGTLQYAGFWQRFGAYWIDVLVMLPLTGVAYFLGEKSRLFLLYWLVPGLIIGLLFHVYLVKRYGGTPGKLVLKTRIAMTDGSAVTTKAALLRYAVLFVLSSLSSVAVVMGAMAMSDEVYFSLGYLDRAAKMVALAPGWYYTVSILLQIWVWGEFITMMFNKRRRAVHDFIAGTVVIRTTA